MSETSENAMLEMANARVKDAFFEVALARKTWVAVWEAYYAAHKPPDGAETDEERAARIEARNAAAVAEQQAKQRLEMAEETLRAALAAAEVYAKM